MKLKFFRIGLIASMFGAMLAFNSVMAEVTPYADIRVGVESYESVAADGDDAIGGLQSVMRARLGLTGEKGSFSGKTELRYDDTGLQNVRDFWIAKTLPSGGKLTVGRRWSPNDDRNAWWVPGKSNNNYHSLSNDLANFRCGGFGYSQDFGAASIDTYFCMDNNDASTNDDATGESNDDGADEAVDVIDFALHVNAVPNLGVTLGYQAVAGDAADDETATIIQLLVNYSIDNMAFHLGYLTIDNYNNGDGDAATSTGLAAKIGFGQVTGILGYKSKAFDPDNSNIDLEDETALTLAGVMDMGDGVDGTFEYGNIDNAGGTDGASATLIRLGLSTKF